MIRVRVIVEGSTEESFVKNVLAPSFWPDEIFIEPIIVGRPGHKGGNTNYPRVKRDIVLHLKQDPGVYCSTMLDFYGLGKGFPGMPAPENLTNIERAVHVEDAVKADICREIPDFQPDIRFLPYLQLHEYEALLFSDAAAFANGIKQPSLVPKFRQIRDEFETPEDIDDSPLTAPSKRILTIWPRYNKAIDGTLGAQAVGVDRMRAECKHFAEWLERLAALRGAQST